MSRYLLSACLLASMTGSHLAAAERLAPVLLPPQSQWQIDFGDKRCRAVRIFGTQEAKTLLIIDQLLPEDSASWVVAGSAIEALRGDTKRWSATFGSLRPSVPGSRLHPGNLEGYGDAVIAEGFVGPDEAEKDKPQVSKEHEKPELTPNQETGKLINWIDLSDGKQTQRLATGNMGELLRLMKLCSDNIVKVWGLDPDVQANLSRRAEPDNLKVIARRLQETYSDLAVERGAVAIMAVRVMIDADGTPTSCTITEKSEASSFGETACKEIMKVARFTPALDAAGQPVASYWASDVIYTISGRGWSQPR